jgi:hypothetical protein
MLAGFAGEGTAGATGLGTAATAAGAGDVLTTERPGVETEPPMDDLEYSGFPLDLELIERRDGVFAITLHTALETRWLE